MTFYKMNIRNLSGILAIRYHLPSCIFQKNIKLLKANQKLVNID